MVKIKANDPDKVFKILLGLVNNEEEKYVMKKYITGEIGSYETVHGDRVSTRLKGDVWILGTKEVINGFDTWNTSEKEPAAPEAFRHAIAETVNNGSSMVVLTDYDYDWCVLPSDYGITSATINKIDVGSILSNVCCYTYEDELGTAVKKLIKYLRSNGREIKRKPLEMILEQINVEKAVQRVLNKKEQTGGQENE